MARVLVVDDEPDILLLHRLNLEQAGHEVILAADGTKALERIDSDKPDIVVLDVLMPSLDGWSVLRELKTRVAAPPVVVVSALPSHENSARAIESGAKAYIEKLESESLIRTIDHLLAS